MGDFFKGWRRKAGCVLLVMATLLMAGWIRTGASTDAVIVRFTNSAHEFLSMHERIVWKRYTYTFPNDPLKLTGRGFITWKTYPVKREFEWHWGGFGFRGIDKTDDPTNNQTWWCIPYWPIVIPLTLLSAYLILWKPRKRESRPPQSSAEPAKA